MKNRYAEEQFIGFRPEADAGLPLEEQCRKQGFSDGGFAACNLAKCRSA